MDYFMHCLSQLLHPYLSQYNKLPYTLELSNTSITSIDVLPSKNQALCEIKQ